MEEIRENKKGFKKTEIGYIPDDWKPYKLGDLGDFKNGINKGKDDFGFGVPFINLMDVFGKPVLKMDNWQLVNASKTEIENYSLEKGDVLFIRSSVKPSGVGLTSVVKEDIENTVYSGFLIRFRPNTMKVFNIDFLQYCFFENNFRRSLIVRSSTSANTNINQENLQELKVILPPLPEQQKIATILSKWDELIETQTQLIEEKEKQKKGLMQKLLTGEVRFPGFEEEWEEVELGEVAEFSNGKAHENIVDENGKYILITSKFISTDGAVYRSLNDRLTPLYKNDIVMVMSDVPNGKAIAKCYLVEKDNLYSLNQRIGRFVFNDHDPKFMFYLLNRNPYFLAFDSGVGQTNLRKDDILECPLLLPSIPEQKKISSTLNAIDEEIQSLYDKLEAIKLQKKGLMQQLLTGKIRVKV